MTGSIPDPRAEAAVRFLQEYLAAAYGPSPGSVSYSARMLELIDAADEASGVRRVTGPLFDALMRLYHVVWEETATMDEGPGQRYVVMSHEDAIKLSDAASAVEDILFPPAADSPVGGVS